MNLSQPVICDPEGRLYDAFGLKRANPGQIFSIDVLKRGVRAAKAGHKGGAKPIGDPWRLPGAFVVDRHGEIVWSYRSRNAGDNAPVAEIASAWARAV
jgi:hypothetical protein